MLEEWRKQVDAWLLLDEVWGKETEEFLDRLAVSPGERVLDLGCGPGLGLSRFSQRVGARGEVVGFEADALLVAESRRRVEQQKLSPARVVTGDFMQLNLGPAPFDLIYCGWHFSRLPDRRTVLRKIRTMLAPQGRLAILDFHREGARVFPVGTAIETVLEASLRYYESQGVELFLTGMLPEDFLTTGFLLEGAWPHQKVETPGSSAYRWFELLLQELGPRLVAEEFVNSEQWAQFLTEWESRRVDPKTLVFSPPAVAVLARPLAEPKFSA